MTSTTQHLWCVLLDLLFPTPKKLRIYDTIHVDVLARTSIRTLVDASVPVLAPLPYDHALVSGAVHAAKYYGHERSAMLLGTVLAPFVAEELAERRMFGTYHTVLVVPLPLHKSRERERGYNQATRIARALCTSLADDGLVLASDVLTRVKHTAPQARQTSRAARKENVAGAFAVVDSRTVAGRDVLLLDDVVTTGATLAAAREVLLNAGAREVFCVCVAH